MYICMWMYVVDQPDIADIDRSTYRSPRFTEESSANQLRADVLLDLPEFSSGETAIGLRQRVLIRLGTFLGCRPQNMILKRNQG